MPIKSRPSYGLRTFVDGSSYAYIGEAEYISYSLSSPDKKGRYKTQQDCFHAKLVSPGSHTWHGDGSYWTGSWMHHVRPNADSLIAMALSRGYIELDFQKNNSFELIPFLVDFDDTLALFGKSLLRFFKGLTYGEVTWGIAPLISDIKSLISSLSDIIDGMLKSYEKLAGKRISRRCPVSYQFSDPWFDFKVDGIVTYTGFVDIGGSIPKNPLDNFGVFLDEIGLNLDLRTIWDVIPLSFVVDYLLPVGDALESLHPRGWFNPTISISGSSSVKLNVSLTGNGTSHRGSGGSYTVYDRKVNRVMSLPSRPPIIPEFKAPSWREWFNIGYLGLTSKRPT